MVSSPGAARSPPERPRPPVSIAPCPRPPHLPSPPRPLPCATGSAATSACSCSPVPAAARRRASRLPRRQRRLEAHPAHHLQALVGSDAAYRRYWARSSVGCRGSWPRGRTAPTMRWRSSSAAAGEPAADPERRRPAPARRQPRVLDLHGRLDAVVCTGLRGAHVARGGQGRIEAANPGWHAGMARAAPDGDADIADEAVAGCAPRCARCDGLLKPDVVFFGEAVPRTRVEQARRALHGSDAMLVAGSSLMVWSGLRFVRAAVDLGLPVAILNRGRTRADDWPGCASTRTSPPHWRRLWHEPLPSPACGAAAGPACAPAAARHCVAGFPEIYGPLFADAQRALPDPKAMVDAIPRAAPAAIAAEYARAATRRGLTRRSSPGFRASAPGRRRLPDGSGARCRRAHRPPVARARAPARAGRRAQFAAAPARTLRRAGRALRRDLLLGFLLHDARPARERPHRPGAVRWSPTSRP